MHQSVLLKEAVELLGVRADGVYVDATAGAGGHVRAILERLGPTGRVYAIDRDPAALARLASTADVGGDARCCLRQGNFADLSALLKAEGLESISGVLMDLGISSDQLDDPERGLSFNQDGPLDMRLCPRDDVTAAEIVNQADLTELVHIFRTYGEESRAMAVARAIVREREKAPIETTTQLADMVSRVVGRKRKHHPATRVFQALRIAVNDELGSLERGLDGALASLEEGGRLVVISFHSLEDRIVKRFMRRHEGTWESLHEGGEAWRGELPRVKRTLRKFVSAGDDEVRRNPRARSAKCRAVERVRDQFEDMSNTQRNG